MAASFENGTEVKKISERAGIAQRRLESLEIEVIDDTLDVTEHAGDLSNLATRLRQAEISFSLNVSDASTTKNKGLQRDVSTNRTQTSKRRSSISLVDAVPFPTSEAFVSQTERESEHSENRSEEVHNDKEKKQEHDHQSEEKMESEVYTLALTAYLQYKEKAPTPLDILFEFSQDVVGVRKYHDLELAKWFQKEFPIQPLNTTKKLSDEELKKLKEDTQKRIRELYNKMRGHIQGQLKKIYDKYFGKQSGRYQLQGFSIVFLKKLEKQHAMYYKFLKMQRKKEDISNNIYEEIFLLDDFEFFVNSINPVIQNKYLNWDRTKPWMELATGDLGMDHGDPMNQEARRIHLQVRCLSELVIELQQYELISSECCKKPKPSPIMDDLAYLENILLGAIRREKLPLDAIRHEIYYCRRKCFFHLKKDTTNSLKQHPLIKLLDRKSMEFEMCCYALSKTATDSLLSIDTSPRDAIGRQTDMNTPVDRSRPRTREAF